MSCEAELFERCNQRVRPGAGGRFIAILWMFAGVILIALFSIDLAFGLAARSIRQFQVFELSLNLKNLAFVILLPLLAYPLFRIIETKISSLENLDKLLEMLK